MGDKQWLLSNLEKDLQDSPMLSNLLLSHLAMPTKLRRCSLFLAVFPEAAVIRRRHLVFWWIGEGIITKTSTMTAEEAGNRAFLELIDYGIIQPHNKNPACPTAPSSACMVDPWVHWMLVSAARTSNCQKSNCLVMRRAPDTKNTGQGLKDEPPTVNDSGESHIRPGPESFSNSARKGPKGEVSTVYNVDESHLSLEPEFFSKIENLKVVQLGRWTAAPRDHIEVDGENFLKKLRKQKHLKYLSLRGISSVTSLPSSLSQCRNMVILDLRACHHLEKFPCDISSWRKLTHLIVSDCYLLEEFPKGLDRLPSLEVLKGFVIDHWRKNHCSLMQLSRLNTLRKLSLTVGMAEFVPTNKKMSRSYSSISRLFWHLSKLTNLRILTVTWQMVSSATGDKQGKEKKTAKSPSHPPSPQPSKPFGSLEKLELRCYPEKELPKWFLPEKFPSLERLYIRGGKLEIFPMVTTGEKWGFWLLRLNYLESLTAPPPWFDVADQFPRLSFFERIREVRNENGENRWETIAWKIEEEWAVLGEKLRMDAKPFVADNYLHESEEGK